MTADPAPVTAPNDDLSVTRTVTVLPRMLRRRSRRIDAFDAGEPWPESGAEGPAESAVDDEPTEASHVDDEVFVREFIPVQQIRDTGPFGTDERWDVMHLPEFIERMADRRESGATLALVAVGLTGFEGLSLTAGPQAWDMALRNAHRIMRWMLGPDNVAYLGADCFGVLLRYDESASGLIDSTLERLRRTDLSDHLTGIFATASAGMAVLDDPEISAEEALYEAECAMLSAKDTASKQVVIAELATSSRATGT